jgi:hypothetical protein
VPVHRADGVPGLERLPQPAAAPGDDVRGLHTAGHEVVEMLLEELEPGQGGGDALGTGPAGACDR